MTDYYRDRLHKLSCVLARHMSFVSVPKCVPFLSSMPLLPRTLAPSLHLPCAQPTPLCFIRRALAWHDVRNANEAMSEAKMFKSSIIAKAKMRLRSVAGTCVCAQHDAREHVLGP
jgi:hypothetical protein